MNLDFADHLPSINIKKKQEKINELDVQAENWTQHNHNIYDENEDLSDNQSQQAMTMYKVLIVVYLHRLSYECRQRFISGFEYSP